MGIVWATLSMNLGDGDRQSPIVLKRDREGIKKMCVILYA